MSFLYPYVLCALLLLLRLAAAGILVSRGSGRGWRRLVSAVHEGELVTRRPAWRTVLPAALCLAALTWAIVALARPSNAYHETGTQITGRNLLAERGSYSYVETFTGTRGWIKTSAMEVLVPNGTPRTPLLISW